MRLTDNGCFYTVNMSEREVYTWSKRWPCFGDSRPLWFQFDKRSGDLVDMSDYQGCDDSAVLAMADDAQVWGKAKLCEGIRILVKLDPQLVRALPQVSVSAHYSKGPHNLIKAAKLLPELRKAHIEANGNLGHWDTWLEIDGLRIEPADLTYIAEPEPRLGQYPVQAQMQQAKALLAQVNSGRHASYLLALNQLENVK